VRIIDLTQEDKTALGQALREFSSTGKVTTKCPRCGSALIAEKRGTRDYQYCENSECIITVQIGV